MESVLSEIGRTIRYALASNERTFRFAGLLVLVAVILGLLMLVAVIAYLIM